MTSDCSLNLNGGTTTASGIAKTALAGGIGHVYFNGGTLKASATNATFMQGLDSATVGPGGAKIDTNGNDITIAQDLNKPTDKGVKNIPIIDGGGGYLGQPSCKSPATAPVRRRWRTWMPSVS